MPKKTSILIVILVIVTGALIFLAVRNDGLRKVNEDNFKKEPTGISPTVTPYAHLGFDPESIDIVTSASNEASIEVSLDTKGEPVFGVQVELLYDPGVISDISVMKPDNSFFGKDYSVLINEIDREQGRITYAVSLNKKSGEKVGKGVIARIDLKVFPNANGQSLITFLPKTSVTSLESSTSVLKNYNSLKLIFSR